MKKLVPAHNANFHLGNKGLLTIYPSESFTILDYWRTFKMAKLHAKKKKIKKPEKINRFWDKSYSVPTLTDVV